MTAYATRCEREDEEDRLGITGLGRRVLIELHNDGWHNGRPSPGCPSCQEEKELRA